MATNTWSVDGFHVAGMTPAVTQTFADSFLDGIVAAGTIISNATVVTGQTNVVATTAASTGIVFDPSLLVPGATIVVKNNGASTLNVWGGASVAFDAGGAGSAVTLATTVLGRYLVVSATQLRTVT